MDHLSEWRALN